MKNKQTSKQKHNLQYRVNILSELLAPWEIGQNLA